MHIVGTAGHVDHGKSTLIRALTGTDPDRLKEEKDREMTIDLGFASMDLPGGETIGIVDVPGHLDFISNMLSGVGSIDAVLLVVAADEGVSPQTREHLAILDLLGIDKGLVVITKTDLVSDPEWLDLVELESQELLEGSSLANAQYLRVSAESGVGLDALKQSLAELLKSTPSKADLGKPRLPVDRVFSLQGFGTVVTGTLLDGAFSLGESVVCLPSGLEGRVRGIQNHKHKLQRVEPGYRTALNLSGLDKDEIHRGDLIAHPGDYKATRLIDLRLRALKTIEKPIHHNQGCQLYIGAAEVQAMIRLLGTEKLEASEEAFVQLRLSQPVIAARGDRVILRQASPSVTLGGGTVLNPHPEARYKRFDEARLSRLQNLLEASSLQPVLDLINTGVPLTPNKIAAQLHLQKDELLQQLEGLVKESQALWLDEQKAGERSILGMHAYQNLENKTLSLLDGFHQQSPFKAGLAREDLRIRLGLNKEVFEQLIKLFISAALLRDSGKTLALASHQIRFSQAQEAKLHPILEQFASQPYDPPDQKNLEEALGADLVEGLVGAGRLVRVSNEILFSPTAYVEMKNWVQESIQQNGSLTLAAFRDRFATSRKYAAAFLEHLDIIGLTVRKGDIRVLRIVK